MSGFFSKETFKFLSDLDKNNNREWFNANKHRYEQHVKEPLLEFITAAGPALKKISSQIVADPRPSGGSMFRIYRDTRFASDKSPYKTNAGAHFRHAAGKDVPAPTYYLHLQPTMSFIAGGMYMPDAKGLLQVREAIVDRTNEWKAVTKKVDLGEEGDSLKRAPKGFDPDHPFVEDLKRKHFVTSVTLSQREVCSARFLSDFIGHCKTMSPLMKFLASATDVAW